MNPILRCLSILVLACSGLATASAKPVPDLKFHDLAGHTQKLSSLRGSITVINFWATWCGPCREEMPRLSALSQQYASKGVRFVAISVDESKDRAKIEPYLQQQKIALDVWVGADLDTLDRLGLGNVLPATLVLDKDGEPIGRISGEARDADISGYLDWLLGNRQAPAPPPQIKRY
jgi:thiol-disulfide isomerase/thioredoxin